MPTICSFRGRILLALLLTACWLGILSTQASAAPSQTPPAGTSIGNQATATYTDGAGTTRTVTSNVVTTVVQQVASLTLTTNNTTTAAVGNMVSYPHVLTNTGNGTDTYTISVAQAGGNPFNLSNATIYYDANGNGQVDPGDTVISNGSVSPAVPAGKAISLIVQGTVPASASGTSSLTITATSSTDGSKTASNTDAVTVTTNAVISLSKAVSSPSGAPGTGPYTYTLAYTNTGNSDAASVSITDAIPSGLTYVAGSGRWSVSGATALTDASGGDPAGIAYDYNVTTPGTITIVVSSVPKNSSGYVTFQFNVGAATSASTIYNQASLSYSDLPSGGSTITGTSNKVPFDVTPYG